MSAPSKFKRAPYLALLLALGLSFLFLPSGKTLWSKVLSITGALNTGPFQLPGPEGCTPGFWKQPHHLDQWQGYEPGDHVDTVFGVESTDSPTLLEALETGGGGEFALLRQAVAALLNAAHADVNYPHSEANVIEIVSDAFESGEFEDAKDILEEANEAECGLSSESELELESIPTATPSATPTPTLVQDEACQSPVWAAQEAWPEPFVPQLQLSEAFEVELQESPSLGEALLLEGEGLEALMRESTTALLNAASPDVEFEMTVEGVLAVFQDTVATGNLEVISSVAKLLSELNDGECPLEESELELESELEPTPTPTMTPTPTGEPPPTKKPPTDTPEPTATPTPTLEPTPTDTPTATSTDTPTPTSTDTPEPTATETLEPTATDTQEPTATDTPEPTATDTPDPTPTPAP